MTRMMVGAVVMVVVAALGSGVGASASPAGGTGTLSPAVISAAGAQAGTRAEGAVIDPALASRLASAAPTSTLDVIVVLRQQAALSSNAGSSQASRVPRVVQELRRIADLAQRSLLTLLAQRRAQGLVTKVDPLWIIDGIALTAQPAVIREIAGRSDVLQIRLSATVAAPSPPQTALSNTPVEQNLLVVNARQLWDLGYLGQGVVVANMDTGVDASHPDLSATWRGGSNSWYDPNGEHPTTPTDVNGHGTWTMGVIVGGSAGGSQIGMAPSAKWIAAKIFNDRGVATTTGIHKAFQWLLDPDGNASTADAPNVVNDSWVMSSGGCNPEFQLDLQRLRAAGILPVFAAGNGGPTASTSYSPANNPEAFPVGATNNYDVLDASSSRGPGACGGSIYPDLTAPGDDITTSDLYDGYVSESGTSMAAPHVAGALALLLSAFPNLSADRQAATTESSALDLGIAGPDNGFGYGRLDALSAYDWLANQPDYTLTVSPSPATTSPGGSVTYTVSAAALNGFSGDVTLSLSGLSPSQASWSFAPATIAAAGGTSTLTVATASTLAPGTYSLVITGASGTTSHSVPVNLVVTPPPDFTVTASPSSASAAAGVAVSYSITVGSVAGFTGNVDLSLSGLSPSQAGWTFAPSTISGGAGTSVLTVTSAASLAPGTYGLTITATSGAVSHTASVNLVVAPPPDFSLTASPTSASTTPGASASYTVTVAPMNGFSGTVNLSLAGLSASQGSWTFAPSTVSGGSGASALTVTTASSLAAGTYALTITGTSGALSHTFAVSLVVARDFTVALSPSSLSLARGRSGTYMVTLGSLGGFSGSVSLSVAGLPSGATATFSRNPASAPGTSSMTVRTTGFTTRGTFTLKVTAKSGSLVHQSTATLVVT